MLALPGIPVWYAYAITRLFGFIQVIGGSLVVRLVETREFLKLTNIQVHNAPKSPEFYLDNQFVFLRKTTGTSVQHLMGAYKKRQPCEIALAALDAFFYSTKDSPVISKLDDVHQKIDYIAYLKRNKIFKM